jgi:hypothetical protein
MKKLLVLVVLCIFLLTACGSNLYLDNRVYKQYGLFNQHQVREQNIEYDVIWGNVFWSFFLCETLIVPVYFIGFALFEPVGVKVGTRIKESEG